MDLKPHGEEAARLAAQVGTPLSAARTRRGLTMAELSRRSGVNASTISALERGQQRPTRKTLHRLAGALAPLGAETFAERLIEAAGPSLADETMPTTVARELVVEILGRAVGNLGLDVTDDRVRTAVVAAIREVTGEPPGRALEAS